MSSLLSAPLQIWIGAIFVMLASGTIMFVGHQHRQDRNRWRHVRPLAPVVNARTAQLRSSRGERLVAPIVDAVSNGAQRFLRPSWLSDCEILLEQSGPRRHLKPRNFMAVTVAMVPVGILLGLFMARDASGSLRLAALIGTPFLTWRIPSTYLKGLARRRAADIDRELPDVLDQITISIGAGLGLQAAMTRVAARSRGNMGAELNRTMQDIRIGIDRTVAFEGLAQRTTSEDLKNFARSMVQGLEMGVPLGPLLRTRAAELRHKRRTNAEEKAQKLSVKLTFPTALCILPALMIVVIGPAVLKVLESGLGS